MGKIIRNGVTYGGSRTDAESAQKDAKGNIIDETYATIDSVNNVKDNLDNKFKFISAYFGGKNSVTLDYPNGFNKNNSVIISAYVKLGAGNNYYGVDNENIVCIYPVQTEDNIICWTNNNVLFNGQACVVLAKIQ